MKKRIVILGCENSHAETFLRYIREDGDAPDVVGVYSDEPAAAAALAKKYGVPVLGRPDEAAGRVDGAMITARSGSLHYRYAAPYITPGAALFIDKPITVSEEEALKLARRLSAAGVPVTGGSSCRYERTVRRLKADAAAGTGGRTVGGYVRSPLYPDSRYDGFFFYAQHLAEIVMEIFGRYPERVAAYGNCGNVTVVFRYAAYDVTGLYAAGTDGYYAVRASEKGTDGGALDIGDDCFRAEYEAYRGILYGGGQPVPYDDLIAPVFVMNAIVRALQTGSEQPVRRFTV